MEHFVGRMNVLISSMGLSPGVVVEALVFFRRNNIRVDRVIVLTTNKALQLYQNLLLEYLEKEVGFRDVDFSYVLPLDDVKSIEDELKVIEKMREAIASYKRRGSNVYLNIAGGRKTMSADLLLLGLMHNVELAIHVLSAKGENVWSDITRSDIGKKIEGKFYSELDDDIKRRLKEAFEPDDIQAVVYPLFLFKEPKLLKATYLYLEHNIDLFGNEDYIKRIKALKLDERDYKRPILELINFLENDIPSKAVKKETYSVKRGDSHTEKIHSDKYQKIIDILNRKEYIYRIEVRGSTTTKELKIVEGDVEIYHGTDDEKIKNTGYRFLLEVPLGMKERSLAKQIVIFTTAYTRNQREYVKNDLKSEIEEVIR